MRNKKQKSKHGRESRIEMQEKKEYKEIKNSKENKKKSKGEKKRKGPIRIFIGKLVLLIFIILLIFIGLFSYQTYRNGWGLKGALMTACMVSAEDIENLDTINILLLGISEDLNTRLTDTIMVCSYNPKNSEISMISIPRDTFAGTDIANAKSSDKINVIFNKNKEKMLKTVSEIVGFNIKYYAVLNNEAVIKIVDTIGGVKFDVPIDMDYDDPTQDLHIHLKKGMQKINGEKAEQLLRFRHNNDGTSYPASYGDNDYGRMKTQRAFIEETIKQSLKVRNIIFCKAIYNTISKNIETNYDINELKKYIPTLADFSFENIKTYQLPGQSELHNEIWFFVYNKQKTKDLIKEIY